MFFFCCVSSSLPESETVLGMAWCDDDSEVYGESYEMIAIMSVL